MSRPVEVTPAVLAALAPPVADDDVTKHGRGTITVIGGSCETPGAVLLAGLAALRAGAGRLRLVVDAPCTVELAVAVPEARVSALDGDVAAMVERSDAVLIGPGMLDPDGVEPALDAVTAAVDDGIVVIDAGALPAAGRHPEWIRRLDGRALLVPNSSELEALGVEDALSAAERYAAVVAVRGAETWIATPDGELYVDRRGTPGLATSGSGDVAVGIAAGLAARGSTPLSAAVWSAAAHGRAGERLGGVGFLARELLDELRGAFADLSAAPS